MKRSRIVILCLAAAAAFVVSLLVVMPASVMGYFLPPGITVGTLTGSVWNGSTDNLVIGERSLGALQWKLHPLHLFRGRLALDAELNSAQGRISGWYSFGLGGNVDAQNVEMRWPLAALPFGAIPPGWDAQLNAKLRKLSLQGGRLKQVLGVFEAHNLQQPPPDAVAIGSYRLTFDESSRQEGKLVGRLQDTEGPMQVSGSLTLDDNREFTLEGLVAPRSNAPASIVRTLQFLGEPDVSGQRPFSVAGNY